MSASIPPHEWDLSAQEKRLISERAILRQTMKAKYEKLSTDPYQESSVFDPAIQRYISMKATRLDYFRPVPRNFLVPIMMGVAVVGLQLAYNYRRRCSEEDLRSGKVTYYERRWNTMNDAEFFV